jgi:hypothetical protein
VRRSSRALLLGVAAAGALVVAPTDAHAWCRTTTNVDFVESAAKPCDDIGKPIYWSSRCVGFSIQRDASVQVDLATARDLEQKAFNEWSTVDCPPDPVACVGKGAGNPSISASDLGPVDCDAVEYNSKVGNANIIMFRDVQWPHENDGVTLALTTVTFSIDSGEIYDADMEINSDPRLNKLTTGDTGVVYDLWSILTHETGHMLGLAHTQPTNNAATMFPYYNTGKTFMRDPSQDDICAICAAYPPGRTTVCDSKPRNGFSLTCGGGDLATTKKGCHCSIVGEDAGGSGLAAAGSLLALVLGLVRRSLRSRH